MITFKEYITEGIEDSLVAFDIDDTLFRTTAEVKVMKDGKEVESLTAAEYNEYDLKDGESYDYGEFRSAKKFADSAKPIKNMISTAKKLISRNADVVMVTARADFDDKHKFLDVFRKHGIDIDRSHVYRAGNITSGTGPSNKAKIIDGLLRKKKYVSAYMFDDHMDNLKAFQGLKRKHKDVKFHSIFVNEKGAAKRV